MNLSKIVRYLCSLCFDLKIIIDKNLPDVLRKNPKYIHTNFHQLYIWGKENYCTICYSHIFPKNIPVGKIHYITVLPCDVKHMFCKECFLKWIEYDNSCPLCRTTFQNGQHMLELTWTKTRDMYPFYQNMLKLVTFGVIAAGALYVLKKLI